MVRLLLPLAVVIPCACTTASTTAPVGNRTAGRSRAAPRPDLLGLAEGVTWRFAGTRTIDDGNGDVTTSIELVTTVVAARRDGDRTAYQVRGWPDYGLDAARETEIVVDGGVVRLDGEPWLRLEPAVESLPCGDDGYCWKVEPAGDAYEIFFRTSPDVTVYTLQPGRGLVAYAYHHNGTTDDVELHRVD